MKRIVCVLVVAGVAAGGLAWWAVRYWGREPPPPAPPDPRLTFATPFQNVHPDVKYVGDAACAACHVGHAEAYRQHPMGRSFAPIAQGAELDRYDAAAHNPFTKFEILYQIERAGPRVVHRAERKTADGRPLFEVSAPVAYEMGSGTRGRSYLVERDGFLFQSPVSWYAQKQVWDLAPGYTKDRLFDRPITPECLFCHANDANPVADSLNRYQAPLFRGHAIGCERCHGPGERHVAFREAGGEVDGVDPSIVNPKHLEPELREAVCQQCHLQGEVRVVRRGQGHFDYRPGLPLHLFRSVFLRLPKLADRHKAVGHVEQMEASRCYQASAGRLGCVSCHDPHQAPAAGERVAYFRGRCLNCHGEKGCKLEPAVRRRSHADDSCTACHMPRAASSDIVHTAVTDHRVPRRPESPARDAAPPVLDPDEVPLVFFHPDQVDARDPERVRDLGLALNALSQQHPDVSAFVAPLAEPRLAAALTTDPYDVAAREALARTWATLGRVDEAVAEYEKILAAHPHREESLFDASLLALRGGDLDRAVRLGRRLTEAYPWTPTYHEQLARALAAGRNWAEAEAACRAALRLNPARRESRQLLIRSLVAQGQRQQAAAEVETLAALEPAHAGDLRRWFANLSR